MESCASGLTSWNSVFFFFPFTEKLYPPVCSTVPASLQAEVLGHGIIIRAKVEQKGRKYELLLGTAIK